MFSADEIILQGFEAPNGCYTNSESQIPHLACCLFLPACPTTKRVLRCMHLAQTPGIISWLLFLPWTGIPVSPCAGRSGERKFGRILLFLECSVFVSHVLQLITAGTSPPGSTPRNSTILTPQSPWGLIRQVIEKKSGSPCSGWRFQETDRHSRNSFLNETERYGLVSSNFLVEN